jgi:uncharacterized protein
MITPTNGNLSPQFKKLIIIILKSPVLKTILERATGLSLPNWYLGAGCVAQTVWNYLSGRDLLLDICDADLVYFDENDLSFESENIKISSAHKLFSDMPIFVDVKNQARVHLWYEEHFGYSITPYQSVEEAINSWPTTATAAAVRTDENGYFSVCAPFGLEDLFGMIVRPNKKQITEEIYLKKVKRWKACWPGLRIIPWSAAI